MDERIVVSISLSHMKGRQEGIRKKLAREYGHEPTVPEIREYVQDLAYAAIDEDIKPRPKTWNVKLGADGLPTGEFLVDKEYWSIDSPVRAGEQWATIEAIDIDDLQQKMKVFR